CCRRAWDRLPANSRIAVEIIDECADGRVAKAEIKQAFAWAAQGVREAEPGVAFDAAHAIVQAVYGRLSTTAATIRYVAALTGQPGEPEYLSALVRCVFGMPFRPVTLNPVWLTTDVLALTRSIYDERAFDRLPILADALQDAGCENADILDHCRGPGPHVRGCW